MANKMNLPNRLSVLRVCLVPLFMAAALFFRWSLSAEMIARTVAAALFGAAAFTDFLDGKIARKRGLVTDFGKFIDPLADKFMVFGACITLLVIDSKIASVFVWVSAIVMLRELAITSLRLVVVGKSGVVIAASFFGKCKTVSQIIAILILFLEPVIAYVFSLLGLYGVADFFSLRILSYIGMAVMTFTTVASGIDYLRSYLPHIDTNK